jgi:hypothetical protein
MLQELLLQGGLWGNSGSMLDPFLQSAVLHGLTKLELQDDCTEFVLSTCLQHIQKMSCLERLILARPLGSSTQEEAVLACTFVLYYSQPPTAWLLLTRSPGQMLSCNFECCMNINISLLNTTGPNPKTSLGKARSCTTACNVQNSISHTRIAEAGSLDNFDHVTFSHGHR